MAALNNFILACWSAPAVQAIKYTLNCQ